MNRQMMIFILAGLIILVAGVSLYAQMESNQAPGVMTEKNKMNLKKLTADEKAVIINKGTEAPFTGKYVHNDKKGTYTCKQCGAPLFKSDAKFDSKTGWPSFDAAIKGAVKEITDRDTMRTEIVCAKCGAHLGHVFKGEGFTEKNTRHCVNSISLDFAQKEDNAVSNSEKEEKAYFAGGCFWGVEYFMEQQKGVIKAVSGYMGGDESNPTYGQVSAHKTGHAETVEVVFNPHLVSFEELATLFFNIHDPTQSDGQGPDIGPQYRSEIFYSNDKQKQTAQMLIGKLKKKGYKIVTKLAPAKTFWPAEDYHQDYYEGNHKTPYCHHIVDRFK